MSGLQSSFRPHNLLPAASPLFSSLDSDTIVFKNFQHRKHQKQSESPNKAFLRSRLMKRAIALNSGESPVAADGGTKRRKRREGTLFANLDDDMLFEVLKHTDARTLAAAACVSRRWRSTAEDECLWEMICTRHWANIDCGSQQLRSVVLALGGFRRLHALCLWPLLKRPSCSSTTSSYPPPVVSSKRTKPRWGKDEVNLSLSLLSIRYYEKMNFNNRGR